MFTLWWNRQDSAPVSDQHLVCYELCRSLISITKKLGATKITEHLKRAFSPRFHIRNFLDSGFCSVEVWYFRLPACSANIHIKISQLSRIGNKIVANELMYLPYI